MKVNKTNCRTLLEQALSQHSQPWPSLPSASPSPKAINLEPPSGQIPLASTLYIAQPPIEIDAYQAILQPRAFIRIKAPEKMGKTSLMVRILAHAALQNYHTVRLSLNRAGTQVYASTDRFLRWFCVNVAQQLGLESRLDDYWDEDNSALMNSTIYFQGYLLNSMDAPVVLALDEVNQLFDYPKLARDVLALLRSWYEETRDISVWQKLWFVLVCSTEAYIPLPTN